MTSTNEPPEHAYDPDYMPSDPPTVDDWRYLYDRYEARADRNRRRSRTGLIASIIAIVIGLSLGVGGLVIYLSQKDVPKVLDGQTITLRKINELVVELQQAETTRAETAQGQSLALAQIVENVAGAFATPPFPDPGRQRAVEELCKTAAEFRAAAGAQPVTCPAV